MSSVLIFKFQPIILEELSHVKEFKSALFSVCGANNGNCLEGRGEKLPTIFKEKNPVELHK